jgi:RHS repeat-associated protein
VWDIENRLLSIELPDGTIVENSYDADGIRMGSALTPESGGVTTLIDYVTDTSGPLSQVVAETRAGALGAVYPRGMQLLGILRAEEEQYVHGDHLGSVRVLTGPAASVADHFNYEAFGKSLDTVGSHESPFLFAGEQRDPATRLYYLRARWMSPTEGRFQSLDPLRDVSRLSRPISAYAYAESDPIGRLDPSGQSSVGALTISIAVSVAVAIALVTQVISRPLAGGTRSHVKMIRPVVLEDPNVSWSDAEVEMLLSHGRSVLSSRAGLGLVWRGIERRSNLEALDPFDHLLVEPTIDSEKHLIAAIWQLWYEAPNILPVIFVTGFDFRTGTLGYSPALAGTAGPRGSAISRHGLRQHPKLLSWRTSWFTAWGSLMTGSAWVLWGILWTNTVATPETSYSRPK